MLHNYALKVGKLESHELSITDGVKLVQNEVMHKLDDMRMPK